MKNSKLLLILLFLIAGKMMAQQPTIIRPAPRGHGHTAHVERS
jgi:hypothetical protein